MKRVLLVEDEIITKEALSKLCELLGCNVKCCDNGLSAYEEFCNGSFDIVISDIKMPKMDGIELAKKIREKNKEIPIIVCSGEITSSVEIVLKKIGVTKFIKKPFKFNEIAELLNL